MTAITVAPDGGAEAVTARVLSSLPVSYAAADRNAAPRVVVVAGTLGWPVAVQRALNEGSAAAIVVHPEPASLGATLVTPGLVLVDSIWAGNPGRTSGIRPLPGRCSRCPVAGVPGDLGTELARCGPIL